MALLCDSNEFQQFGMLHGIENEAENKLYSRRFRYAKIIDMQIKGEQINMPMYVFVQLMGLVLLMFTC